MHSKGVKFLYESVMGLRKHEGQGCILADEMYVFFLLASAAALKTSLGVLEKLCKQLL